MSISYLVVLRELSGLGSLSIVMASAGQAAAQSLQAIHLNLIEFSPFLSSSISSQGMFTSKLRRKGTLFIGVMDGPFRFEDVKERTEPDRVEILGADPLDVRKMLR